MTEIIKLLPVLAIAISMNIAAGLYYSIGTKELSFSWKKFIKQAKNTRDFSYGMNWRE